MTSRQKLVLATAMAICSPAFAQPSPDGAPVPPIAPVAPAAPPVVHSVHYPSRAEAVKAVGCGAHLVICYDRNGKPLSGQGKLLVRPGDKVTLVVITDQPADSVPGVVSVKFEGRKSDEQTFPAAPPAPGVLVAGGVDAISFVSDAVAADSLELSVDFTRADANGGGASKTSSIPVTLGYSYFNVALLVAATFDGNRKVLPDLSTAVDHAIEPALALNVFPGGREQGVLGYARRCMVTSFKRCVANNLGFQVATTLDLTNATDRFYAGLVFEPVAGLAVVGGVSLRKVAVVPAGGALPPVEAMDGSAPSDSHYAVRAYVGVTLSLDLLTTISQVGTGIKKLAN